MVCNKHRSHRNQFGLLLLWMEAVIRHCLLSILSVIILSMKVMFNAVTYVYKAFDKLHEYFSFSCLIYRDNSVCVVRVNEVWYRIMLGMCYME
jgi:hypothetical protein